MDDPTLGRDLVKQLEQLKSALVPELKSMGLLLNSAARELLAEQDRLSALIREREFLFPQFRPEALAGLAGNRDIFEQVRRDVERASEMVRAAAGSKEVQRLIEQLRFPQFDLPEFSKFKLPEFPQIDWDEVRRAHAKTAVHLADHGWAVPPWISLWHGRHLGDASGDEIEEFFLKSYLGTEDLEGELDGVFETLLSSQELAQWKGLIQDVCDSIKDKRYKVCIPSLVSILEGFVAASLVKHCSMSKRDIRVAKVLNEAKWHESESFEAPLWMSAVTFLNHFFKHSDFENACPTFINRHWILHGRSATDWTITDALKLVNALSSLHWLFAFDEDTPPQTC